MCLYLYLYIHIYTGVYIYVILYTYTRVCIYICIIRRKALKLWSWCWGPGDVAAQVASPAEEPHLSPRGSMRVRGTYAFVYIYMIYI